MMRGGSELGDRGTVLAGRVADIGLPAIAAIPSRECAHDAVARDLGDDRRRCNRKAEAVALYDRLHGAWERRRDITVDEGHVRTDLERSDSPRHRQQCRAQNIDAVDFTRTRGPDPDLCSAAIDAASERPPAGMTLFGSQHLRIVEPLVQGSREAAWVEDHCGGDDRPGERPAPSLVDAADDPFAAPFNREIRHRPSEERLLPCARGIEQEKRPPHRAAGANFRYVGRMFQPGRRFLGHAMLVCRATTLLLAAMVALLLAESPACAFDFFTRHEVTAQFATADGKPLANAEVQVFAPGDLKAPVETGHTDSQGKFVFDADSDGMWTAEARTPDQVARVMIRVGAGAPQQQSRLPPIVVIRGLILLVVLGWWYLLLRRRGRWRQP